VAPIKTPSTNVAIADALPAPLRIVVIPRIVARSDPGCRPKAEEKDRLGVYSARSSRLNMLRSCIKFWLKDDTAMGTSCRFSSTRRAVTVISSAGTVGAALAMEQARNTAKTSRYGELMPNLMTFPPS
jgi:hypothetical protein